MPFLTSQRIILMCKLCVYYKCISCITSPSVFCKVKGQITEEGEGLGMRLCLTTQPQGFPSHRCTVTHTWISCYIKQMQSHFWSGSLRLHTLVCISIDYSNTVCGREGLSIIVQWTQSLMLKSALTENQEYPQKHTGITRSQIHNVNTHLYSTIMYYNNHSLW